MLNVFLILCISYLYARSLKFSINWLNVDGFSIRNNDFKMEAFCALSWLWGSYALPPMEAVIFSLLAGLLFAISWVDFYTFQIPLLFILVGSLIVLYGVVTVSYTHLTLPTIYSV